MQALQTTPGGSVPDTPKRTRKAKPARQSDDEFLLPVARETEQGTLGVLILEPAAIDEAIAAGLTADLFFLPSHRLIFTALLDIKAKGWAINPNTLADYLNAQHKLEQVGGQAYIASLFSSRTGQAGSLPGHIKQLSDTRFKREAARKAQELQRLASNGATPAEIEELLNSFPRTAETVTNYEATTAGLMHRKPAMQGFGFTHETLTNFTAGIVADTIQDNGTDDLQRIFEMRLTLRGHTRSGRVSAQKFAAMQWHTELLGAEAVIYPNKTEHARCAIQLLSSANGIQKRTVYTHTGWRKFDEGWQYLHGGGAIGAAGNRTDLAVALPLSLTPFVLPEPSSATEQRFSCHAVLSLLDAIPEALGVPLIGAAWASVLGGADYSVYFTGQSGSFKSELTALAMSFFGAGFERLKLPANWSSSDNQLEAAAFTAKDALFVIDDFAPTGQRRHDEDLHKKAERVFRSQGNHSGRARLRADGSERPTFSPRGLIMSSGEDVPRGGSLRARLCVVPVAGGAVSKSALSALQRDARQGRYAQNLSDFLCCLAINHEARQEQFTLRHQTLRDELARSLTGHSRTPTMLAHLATAWETWLSFALSVKAISAAESRELWARVWRTLQGISDEQNAQATQHPADRFIELIQSALATGRAHIAGMDGRLPDEPDAWGWQPGHLSTWESGGDLIGWTNGLQVYLEPTASYKAANDLARSTGEGLAVTEGTLWQRMQERGMLHIEANRRGCKVRKQVSAGYISVICVQHGVLSNVRKVEN